MRASPLPWLVVAVLALVGYPASYGALRLAHVLVHSSVWISAEGLDGHHLHGVEGPRPLAFLYQPLISLELAVQERRQAGYSP